LIIFRIHEKPLKIRLITYITPDFDPSSENQNGQKNNSIVGLKNHKIAKTLIVMFLLILPVFVYANVFSFATFPTMIGGFSDVITYESGLIRNTDKNSQTINVLSAESEFDKELSVGGGNIGIIDDTALLASDGLVGENIFGKSKNNGKISVYEVREGDTLSQIADMFGVSINTIRWANDFDGPIYPGQSLVILPVTGVTHVVKNGGTIKDIADIYEADVLEIARFNGLDINEVLNKGDEVIVPNADLNHNHDHDDTTHYASSISGGYFINPVPGGILTQGRHGYNGYDIAAAHGSPIYAAASGKVITSKNSGWNGGYGNYVVISHPNGTQTLYSHQSSNAVYVGQVVNQGDLIGYMGSTGRSTGTHLHFEVRGGTNPLSVCSIQSTCK
jgi:murein DD-endopeptidase MepM/ murein hydrolase activator NlpD